MQRALIALAATILLIGCGSSSDTAEPPATTEAPTTTTERPEPRITLNTSADPLKLWGVCRDIRLAHDMPELGPLDPEALDVEVISRYNARRLAADPDLLAQAMDDCADIGFGGPDR